MTSEDVKDAIATAIQMEKEGRAFYLNAAAQTSSAMGAKLFTSIADDELVHLKTFEKIFEDRIGKEEWDALVKSSGKYKEIPVFPKDLKSSEGPDPDSSELDALHIAMKAEQEAIEYYGKIIEGLADEDVKKAIETIISHERSHYTLLNEEFTYINNTGFWYELDYMGD